MLIERSSSTANTGQLWRVVGPNGTDRSAWLSVLVDLRSEDGGSVTFDSVALADWPALVMVRHRVSLPQTLHDSFPIAVYQVVMTGRHLHLTH